MPFEITREGDFVTTSLDLTGMGHYDCVSAEFSGVLTIDLELTGELGECQLRLSVPVLLIQ